MDVLYLPYVCRMQNVANRGYLYGFPTKNVMILMVTVTWWGVVPRDGLIFEISIEQKLLCLKMFGDFNF